MQRRRRLERKMTQWPSICRCASDEAHTYCGVITTCTSAFAVSGLDEPSAFGQSAYVYSREVGGVSKSIVNLPEYPPSDAC